MTKLLLRVAILSAGLFCLGENASAQTKLSVGYAPIAQNENLFVAQKENLFSKNGLNVTLTPLTAAGVAAIASGTVDLGHAPPGAFLQAVDNGLDLVALGGCGIVSPGEKSVALVAATGVTINKPTDLVGKRVGVPGIRQFLDVMFRRWLKQNGVDERSVTFVEIAIPNTVDVLRTRSVDAIISGEPFVGRTVQTQVGTIVSYFMSDLPAGVPYTLYVSPRTWAKTHAAEIAAFRSSLEDAGKFIESNPGQTLAHIADYTKIPLDVVRAMPIPPCKAVVTSDQLTWLIDVMLDQKLLQKNIRPQDVLWTRQEQSP